MDKKYVVSISMILLIICVFSINIMGCYSMRGDKKMNKKKDIIDLVSMFKLQNTDKIMIETHIIKFQERPYIKKIVIDKEYIKIFLDSLRKNDYLHGLIKAETHYNVTFYHHNRITFTFGVNDWEDKGFIRVGYKDIHSDLFVDKSFFDIFHRIRQ